MRDWLGGWDGAGVTRVRWGDGVDEYVVGMVWGDEGLNEDVGRLCIGWRLGSGWVVRVGWRLNASVGGLRVEWGKEGAVLCRYGVLGWGVAG